MAHENHKQYLACPFCPFGSNEVDSLESHVQRSHGSQQPDCPQPYNAESQLSDAELAQLLAFEEAGLPAELALPDRPIVPARDEDQARESATMRQQPPTASRVGKEQSWVQCACGERVPFLELDAHSDMHAQENISMDEAEIPSKDVEPSTVRLTAEPPFADVSGSFSTDIPRSLRNYGQGQDRPPPPSRGEKRRGPSLKNMFWGTRASPKRKSAGSSVTTEIGKTKQLGKSELGPYAHEKQMPGWLRRMLEAGAKVTVTQRIGADGRLIKVETIANETPHLVPVLARLSQIDRTVERAFYCSPKVFHVCKMSFEGGFCGYRNIQMLLSYIQGTDASGSEHFRGRLPSILKLQDMIENAWDLGFGASGRVETGGIKFTRKFIGTPEALALLSSLNIPCEATAYYSRKEEVEAFETMLCAVCDYFDDDSTQDNVDKVVITDKPPIYFQHHGHSMTIVGVEQRMNGAVNLVVFDPMFNPSPALKKLAFSRRTSFACARPGKLLEAHRRDEKYLKGYKVFELLTLKTRQP